MPPFLQKLFRIKPAAPVAPVAAVARAVSTVPTAAPAKPAAESTMTVPQVAVARLSLLPILQKLPEDLRKNIVNYPGEDATVALPLATIQKQLAAGSVKMSLASLYRQSPRGTFSEVRVEEKRMIEVPLSEVLRHVQPEAFRRRADQRRLDLPTSAPQLFGDRSNPYAIAPTTGDEFPEPDLEPKFTLDDDEPIAGFHPVASTSAPAPMAPLRMPEMAMPKVEVAKAPEPEATETGVVSIPVTTVCADWPEPLRSEGFSAAESVLQIPAILLAASLAKGRAVYRWSQVRAWFQPPLTSDTDEFDATEISLPLKVVAPAFLAHSRPRASRKEVDLDEEIPALFNNGDAPAPAAVEEPIAAPEAEAEPVRLEAPRLSMTVEEAAVPAPVDAPLAFRLEEKTSEPAPAAPLVLKMELLEEPEPVAEAAPASIEAPPLTMPVAAAPAPILNGHAHALGTLFGRPQQQTWGPQEIIDAMVTLPGVAGAIVALREGLVVAAQLPAHMKGDTVAAFLPQIFARLNNYAQEMQLGEVEDVLLTTNGAHFQGYRMGEVYFAVLGIAGEALPWDAIRQVVHELQTQVSP